ncbi:MAG: Acyl-CoA synthetase (AMP-forming)/AMP-acid ligase II [Candidatus Azambacteria bacterium GW2011_GWC1_46_13]|uniref:Acyl-CoA synthetase (AMP-forming)/AMP-acid ligase II n=2 Tax=Candidatus Azamiibacteriota TaxID=1752741 RepID=A0A0G1QTF8_9BACT|nr:MAG: Acyl-CoA synthetase (AMP-forming)/AMP-acid ligase II [Candidatus Azambacteria bacterium GW2011_GWC1_46_13]
MTEKPWLRSYPLDAPKNFTYPEFLQVEDLLIKTALDMPNRTALIFYGKKISYRELNRLSDAFALALMRFGVKKGDRVALLLPNVPQFVIAYYGALKAEAIVVPTNPLYTERELEHQLADSGSQTLVALDIFYPKIKNVWNKTGLRRVILTGVRDYLPWLKKTLYPIKAQKEGLWIRVEKTPSVYDFMELIRENNPDTEHLCFRSLHARLQREPESPAQLQYTGGTTGLAKGAILTHNNLVANVWQCREWMTDLRAGKEIFLGVIPFFHVYGLTACMNVGVSLGATLVLLPKFKTEDVLKAIQKYKTTVFPGIQAMYLAINGNPETRKYNLKSIKYCISGAGPLHQEVQEKFESITGAMVVEGYGLSEASPVTHVNPFSRISRKIGSIGLPLPGTDAKIVDLETGSELGPNQPGELLIKGPQVMQGYWHKPEETAETLKDGWLHTGDIAVMDENGFFNIVDRKKDMIKTGGENVYPREVEEVLFRHPKIKEAVVVGLPDPEKFRGEIIKAYIILKENESPCEQEILNFCSRELAKFKIPRIIEFRKELPKTIVGKVLRRVLVEEELKKQK